MIKRLLSRAVPEQEWPIWAIPAFILGAFLLSGVLAYAFYFGPAVRDLSGLAYAPTADPARVRLDVGGTLFAVPAHYTRNRRARRAKAQNYAELHALLPELTPWSESQAEAFLQTDSASGLVIITIRATERQLPKEKVFATLFRPYITGAGEVRPDGLQGFDFRNDAPYAGKELFRALVTGALEHRTAAPIFICDRAEHPSPSCESRFDLGNTAQASYVFKRRFLSDWETVDAQVKDMIRTFRAAARTQN